MENEKRNKIKLSITRDLVSNCVDSEKMVITERCRINGATSINESVFIHRYTIAKVGFMEYCSGTSEFYWLDDTEPRVKTIAELFENKQLNIEDFEL